jgi:hypothetical protein
MASTCKYSTGNGSVVVGSVDGKIRLNSKISMRMAKTVLPELGSPITHVDHVDFTHVEYLVLICTVIMDKVGKIILGSVGLRET